MAAALNLGPAPAAARQTSPSVSHGVHDDDRLGGYDAAHRRRARAVADHHPILLLL